MVEGFEIENESQMEYARRLVNVAKSQMAHLQKTYPDRRIEYSPEYQCEEDWMDNLEYAIQQWHSKQLAAGGRDES